MPIAATSRRAARLCVALLVVAISLSGQSVAPVAATDPVDWRTCAARPVPLAPARAIDPTLASALTAKVVAWQKARRTRPPSAFQASRWRRLRRRIRWIGAPARPVPCPFQRRARSTPPSPAPSPPKWSPGRRRVELATLASRLPSAGTTVAVSPPPSALATPRAGAL